MPIARASSARCSAGASAASGSPASRRGRK
jgi:hypothetical protein